jgi:TolB-like protein/DNA-binding winged helix-turn-helix (wHTH) protein
MMTIRDLDFLVPKRGERLAFDRYVLDLERGCLLLDENEIALRPKTFGVLHYLVRNCARLISKDEIFAAVWPNIAVTDDALVQSIGELQRAFGEDGSRLIKTVPRRGYRLECNVLPFAPTGQSSTEALPVSAASLDEPGPPNSVLASHTPLRDFETNHPGVRIGRTALTAFTILLAAGMLSSAIWAAWRFPGALEYGGRATTQNAEIRPKPAVAILPFLNQSGEASRDYFTDGLTQDIINAIGRFSQLTVMSWNAVRPYKGRPASPAEIGRDLAVRYQVEGSVRQTDDRVRVSVQLVDMDGKVSWSARFDEAFADVFALQDKITTQIAGALAIRVTDVEQRRAFAQPTGNLEAYDYVLRSRPALQRPTRANNVEARALLRHAIQLDPGYAAAYAALAETYHIAVSMGWAESPTEYLSRAEQMANKALSFDDSEVRAHIVLGRIHIFYHRYEQAMAEMGRALAVRSKLIGFPAC